MTETISKYIPEKAIDDVVKLLNTHPVLLKIVNNRATKHGDFRKTVKGFQITVNNDLNQYQFLLTLIHEIAHLVTYKKYKRVKPHGKEWKNTFQHLMLPFLNPEVFPLEVLPYLANYLKNPKASTSSDVNLTYALKQFDINKSGKSFIFELEQGSIFAFKGKSYKKGIKRRTRIECVALESNRTYLFNQNAEVEFIK
jgi:hypothetical protein